MRTRFEPHRNPIIQAVDAIADGFDAYASAVWNLPRSWWPVLSVTQRFVERVGEMSDAEMDAARAEIREMIDAMPEEDNPWAPRKRGAA